MNQEQNKNQAYLPDFCFEKGGFMRKRLNQDGFTLVEILIVIAIIAILFVTLLPQLDNAINKSRVSNVRNDIRGFQLMTHNFLLANRGQVDYDEEGVKKYNTFLDQALQFDPTTKLSNKSDPWGTPYQLEELGKKTVIRSLGPDETFNTKDDLLIAMYVTRDTVDVCTSGFEPNDIQLTTLTVRAECGTDVLTP